MIVREIVEKLLCVRAWKIERVGSRRMRGGREALEEEWEGRVLEKKIRGREQIESGVVKAGKEKVI